MINIIENLLPESYADRIEMLCKTSVPWYWSENTSGVKKEDTEKFQYGFNHIVMLDDGTRSNFFDTFLPLVYFMEEKTGIVVNELYRIRLALNPCTGVEIKHHAHVDMDDPHKVLLYYVNDSDGDTFMYKEKYEAGKNTPTEFTVRDRISPKKNKAVVFDGHIYHSSSKPTNTAGRFIVNIDFN